METSLGQILANPPSTQRWNPKAVAFGQLILQALQSGFPMQGLQANIPQLPPNEPYVR